MVGGSHSQRLWLCDAIGFDAPKRWKKELDEHVGAGGKPGDGKGVPT
jgi:hypothetical protein